jgi:hypothetical protein
LRWLAPKGPDTDYEINLKPDFKPPFRLLSGLSQVDVKAQKEWLDNNLEKGLTRPSSSSAAFPMVFIKKKEGLLRPYLDDWKLNQGTIKDRSPLPLIAKMLAQLSKAKYISKIDMCHSFSLIRVRGANAWKTAICIRYGLFEFLVMPFGLTNTPATFQ